jgi:TonB family protein
MAASKAAAPIAVPPVAAELDPVVVAPLTAAADTTPPTFVKPAPAPPALMIATSPEAVATSPVPVPAAVARRTPPRLLTGGTPDYPAALRTARVGGNVEVRFTVDSTGRVVNVQAVTGPPQLRPVAEAAVRRWRYEPAHVGNVAVETQTSVSFNFDPSTIRRPQE